MVPACAARIRSNSATVIEAPGQEAIELVSAAPPANHPFNPEGSSSIPTGASACQFVQASGSPRSGYTSAITSSRASVNGTTSRPSRKSSPTPAFRRVTSAMSFTWSCSRRRASTNGVPMSSISPRLAAIPRAVSVASNSRRSVFSPRSSASLNAMSSTARAGCSPEHAGNTTTQANGASLARVVRRTFSGGRLAPPSDRALPAEHERLRAWDSGASGP